MSDVFDAPVLGMTWGWVGTRGTWDTPRAYASMDAMTELGTTWVTLAYTAYQATPFSTDIRFNEAPTLRRDEVVSAIRRARAAGQKVCLKPVVDVADGTWRAHIGFFDWDVPGEPSWTEWFESYRAFLLDAAEVAEAEGVDLLCVGCEMVRADGQDRHWRALIEAVRSVYSGPLTYNCDKYQEDKVSWWDAVDVISSSGYYPSGSWDENLTRIEAVVRRERKPFLFLEAGCPAREDAQLRPNAWAGDGAPSSTTQADYLSEAFSAWMSRDWVAGVMLWDWPAELPSAEESAADDAYCPYAKPGAAVIAKRFKEWGARA